MKKLETKEWYMMGIGVVGTFLTLPMILYQWYMLLCNYHLLVNDWRIYGPIITSILTIVVFMVIAKYGYNLSVKEGEKKYDWRERKTA